MALTKKEKAAIKEVISHSLERKFSAYTPPQTVMPFHTFLLGKDRMTLFSFIHSLNTAFGTTIYEPVAEAIAKNNSQFAQVIHQKKANGIISKGAEDAINQIKNDLEQSSIAPCQKTETEKIRAVCQKGSDVKISLRRADLYLIDHDNCHYPIDIKTAKPNVDGFEKYKENMLKWTASILYEDETADVRAMLAIPYNPNDPEPYKHWTMRGMVEKDQQIKVAETFWDFLAGKPVYEDLLGCFKEVGIEMLDEINEHFARFHDKKAT